MLASPTMTDAALLPPALKQAPAPLLDRAALDADVEALSQTHRGDASALRRAVVARFLQALEDGRARARDILEAGGGGLACAGSLSALQDALIRAIHAFVTTHMFPAPNPTTGERIAILAVGGYGRGALAPGSDIDIQFLLPAKQTPWGESVAEAMLYILWDLKQKVGHSTRSIGESLRQAQADMTVRTALLEARLILGDESLFDAMRARFDAEIVRASPREFVASVETGGSATPTATATGSGPSHCASSGTGSSKSSPQRGQAVMPGPNVASQLSHS